MIWSFYLILMIQSQKQHLYLPHFPVTAFVWLNFLLWVQLFLKTCESVYKVKSKRPNMNIYYKIFILTFHKFELTVWTLVYICRCYFYQYLLYFFKCIMMPMQANINQVCDFNIFIILLILHHLAHWSVNTTFGKNCVFHSSQYYFILHIGLLKQHLERIMCFIHNKVKCKGDINNYYKKLWWHTVLKFLNSLEQLVVITITENFRNQSINKF